MLKYNDFFNEDGNFIHRGYDPYRVADKFEEFHATIFDENGNVHQQVYTALNAWVKSRDNLCHFCDIVTLIHAQNHGLNTKGSYPANYMWR